MIFKEIIAKIKQLIFTKRKNIKKPFKKYLDSQER